MAWRKEDLVQRGHFYAIVDEVDSILIDEARTPLIISGPSSGEANRWFVEFAKIAKTLEAGRRLRGRREEAHDRRARARHREGRGLPRHRQPLRVGEHAAHLVPEQLDQGARAVQARHRLRRDERRGHDRRRAHRPHPGRPSLQRGHPPGDRGEGGRAGQGREPDPRDRDAAELLPPLREARRHDRHGRDRGRRVHVDVPARRRAHPDEQADDPQGPVRPRLQERAGEVRPGRRGHRPAARAPASPSWSAR